MNFSPSVDNSLKFFIELAVIVGFLIILQADFSLNLFVKGNGVTPGAGNATIDGFHHSKSKADVVASSEV